MRSIQTWAYSEPIWHDVCYMSSMRWNTRHYKVVIELTGFSERFEYYEDAQEFAEKLAKETGFEVLLVEINPRASDIFERYVPLALYDGVTGQVEWLND